jgi:hypothetical protein
MERETVIRDARQEWTTEAEERLTELWEGGTATKDEIAAELGYSAKSIESKARRLGIVRPGPTTWADGKEERLKTLWHEGHTADEIAAMLGVKRGSICGKVRRMGLPMRRRGEITRGERNPNWKGGKPSKKANVASNAEVVPKVRRKLPGRLCWLMGHRVAQS